jgi:hypothetical protein
MRKHYTRQIPDGERIRRLARFEGVELLLSWPEKLRKQDITRPDVLAILRTCSVVKSERCDDTWRRTVKGFDRDEGEVFLVVTIELGLKRITVFDGWRG